MILYAKIITDDKRFERMLSLELSDHGIEVLEDTETDPLLLSKDNFFTIVDLDFCLKYDLSDLSSCSNMIGFSYDYRDTNSVEIRQCYAVLHRPFMMDELFAIIFGEEKPVNPKRPRPKKAIYRPLEGEKGNLKMDRASKKAVWNNEGIALSDSEYKVLSLLFDKRGEIVSRREITELLGATDGNICDVYICLLRKKIDNRLGIKLIYTVRGEGYILKN